MRVLALKFMMVAGCVAVVFITMIITIIFSITMMQSTYASTITAAELRFRTFTWNTSFLVGVITTVIVIVTMPAARNAPAYHSIMQP
jgi:uncharacterized membrane protein